jgi:hypothetical protein
MLILLCLATGTVIPVHGGKSNTLRDAWRHVVDNFHVLILFGKVHMLGEQRVMEWATTNGCKREVQEALREGAAVLQVC